MSECISNIFEMNAVGISDVYQDGIKTTLKKLRNFKVNYLETLKIKQSRGLEWGV